MSNDHVRILFKLGKEEADNPPVDYERLWAKRLEQGLFEIDNIPFFVRGISVGDIVSAQESQGEALFSELVRESGNSTLRVIIFDAAQVQEVRSQLRLLGCSTELNASKMLGVDIPAEVNAQGVRDWLLAQQSTGALEFEDACIRHTLPAMGH